jgi:hypothetical protein
VTRRGQPARGDDALGEVLVERQRERQRVGAGAGHPEHLADRGHLGLAAAAGKPLRDVEDEVRRGGEHPLQEAAAEAESLHGVAGVGEHPGERVDRGRGVELLGVVDRGPGGLGDLVAQVVGDPDPHAARTILFVRMIFASPTA